MLMHARMFIGTLVIAAATLPTVARAQEPARTDGWVVLALDDYRALRARAFPATPDPLPPPVDATLTRVDYDLRVNGDTVTGDARLTIDVLKQGWVSIQMPAGLLVRGAQLDGRPTALVDGNPPRVLVSRPGRSVLALEIVVADRGRERHRVDDAAGLRIGALRGHADRAAHRHRPDGQRRLCRGADRGRRREPLDGVRIAGTAAQVLLEAQDRRSAIDAAAAAPKARITELVALGEDASQITVSVNVEVVQGLARDVVLAIPEGVSVNQVSGATVADWKHESGSLTVSFLEPIATSTSLVVSAEMRAPREGTIAIPIVRMPAAERETGGVAVDVIGAGEITDRQPRGFDPADPSDLGDIVEGRESPSMVAFGFKPLAGQRRRGADGHGLAIHAAGRARRQRRGSALRGARRRGRQAARPRALTPSATISARFSRSSCPRSPCCGAPRSPAGRCDRASPPTAVTCCR